MLEFAFFTRQNALFKGENEQNSLEKRKRVEKRKQGDGSRASPQKTERSMRTVPAIHSQADYNYLIFLIQYQYVKIKVYSSKVDGDYAKNRNP